MEAIFSDYYPTFLYVDKYRFSKNWLFAQNSVPYSLIRYIVSGSGTFSLGDKSYDVSADDVFYIPQGSLLSCVAKEEIVFISVRFIGSVQFDGTDMLQTLWHIPNLHNFGGQPEVRECFEKMYVSALSKNSFKMLEIRGYLNLICAYLARTSQLNFNNDKTLDEDRRKMEAIFDVKSMRLRAQKSLQTKNDPRITVLLDYITTHPEKNLTRKEICDIAQISESTLRRLFKEKTGKTVQDFVKETKMVNAARRLLVTNDAIATISYDLGYEAPSYFGKCFKEIFGVSPQEYRRTSHNV